MKKISNLIIYLIIGIVSFAFFLYLSFPYNVLKETIAVQASNATGLSVSIKDLGPRLMVGLNAEGVHVSRGGQGIELKRVSAQVSFLALFLAKVRVNVLVLDSTDGSLDLDLDFGLLDLISGTAVPSSVEMISKKFAFGNIVELALKTQAASPSTSPFVRPLLEKISVVGKLNSDVSLAVNTKDISRTTGSLSLSLSDASIDFDPGMQIPSQKFESAILKASSQNGTLTFDPSSRFKTRDLDIAFTGKITEKAKIEQSILDMQINIQLFKELKSTFSVVLNAMAGREMDGKIDVKISGPLVPGPQVKIL